MIIVDDTQQYPKLIKDIQLALNTIYKQSFSYPVYYNTVTKLIEFDLQVPVDLENKYIELDGRSIELISISVNNISNDILNNNINDSIPYFLISDDDIFNVISNNIVYNSKSTIEYLETIVYSDRFTEDDLINLYNNSNEYIKKLLVSIFNEDTKVLLSEKYKSLKFSTRFKLFKESGANYLVLGILLNMFALITNLIINKQIKVINSLNIFAVIYLYIKYKPFFLMFKYNIGSKLILGKSPFKRLDV